MLRILGPVLFLVIMYLLIGLNVPYAMLLPILFTWDEANTGQIVQPIVPF